MLGIAGSVMIVDFITPDSLMSCIELLMFHSKYLGRWNQLTSDTVKMLELYLQCFPAGGSPRLHRLTTISGHGQLASNQAFLGHARGGPQRVPHGQASGKGIQPRGCPKGFVNFLDSVGLKSWQGPIPYPTRRASWPPTFRKRSGENISKMKPLNQSEIRGKHRK